MTSAGLQPCCWVVRGRLPQSGYSHASWVGEVDGRPIAITGDEGYNAHMQVVDVDPASADFMTEIGRYQTRPEVSIHNINAVRYARLRHHA